MPEAGSIPAPADTGPAAPPQMIDTPQVRGELDCPLCGYSLRGLSGAAEPRCPECGYAFTWQALRGARNRAVAPGVESVECPITARDSAVAAPNRCICRCV
jgi:tRNA(Ile2) C34 agmatinyltransferase TiaS